jgi:hypothetical protein
LAAFNIHTRFDLLPDGFQLRHHTVALLAITGVGNAFPAPYKASMLQLYRNNLSLRPRTSGNPERAFERPYFFLNVKLHTAS